jgi:hypothetical protein
MRRIVKGVTATEIIASNATVQAIEARIAPLRARLAAHPLYRSIRTEAQLRIFMQTHVFAVWDFMSLLKALQSRLTCVSVPWVPTAYPASRRFINEIVLGEESDEYQGNPISHFELYLEAMRQAGASTAAIDSLLEALPTAGLRQALERDSIPAGARAFNQATFSLIEQGKLHCLAAAFTFGREDLIPDMFRALVHDLSAQNNNNLATFIWYLERHIEVDGEDHGPLSLRMVADLCGADEQKWHEAAEAAAQALVARIALWDSIHVQMTA